MPTPTYARRLAALALAALVLWPSPPTHAKAAHQSAPAATAQLRQELIKRSPNFPRILALVRQGADVDAEAGYGFTALMWVAAGGRTDSVRALLAAGADVNAKNRFGETALMKATRFRHADVVRALLAAGAHVNAKTNEGATVLDAATTAEIKALLTQHGAVSGGG